MSQFEFGADMLGFFQIFRAHMCQFKNYFETSASERVFSNKSTFRLSVKYAFHIDIDIVCGRNKTEIQKMHKVEK